MIAFKQLQFLFAVHGLPCHLPRKLSGLRSLAAISPFFVPFLGFRSLRLIVLFFGFLSFFHSTQSAILAWDPSPDAVTPGMVSGYKLYYSTQTFTALSPGVSTNSAFTIVTVSGAQTTNVMVNGLTAGQAYYFAVTAYNAYGEESDISNVLQFTEETAANPSITITAPSVGTTFLTTDVVNIAASVQGFSLPVSRVDFFDGTALLSSVNNSPYQITTTFAAGAHSLTAKAVDSEGGVTSSAPVTITVNLPPNVPPSIVLNSPANNASFLTNEVVSITATASDPDGTIAKVEFFAGASLLKVRNASPYTASSSDLAVGTHTITARATDDRGAMTISPPISITIKVNQLPTIGLTSPANNSIFITGAPVSFGAFASDPDGTLAKVEFFAGSTLVGSKVTAPYSLTSTTLPAGSHAITARATDNKGGVTVSPPVTITIRENQKPAVALLDLANGALVSQPLMLRASASDPDGSIARVEFFAGETSLGVSTNSPYSVSPQLSAGFHVFTAKATDNDGGVTTSAAVQVGVRPKSPGNLIVQ